MGLKVDGNLSIADLIKTAQGDLPQIESSLDKWRQNLMSFLLDHWAALSTQLTCPAKTGDPAACFGCIDTQVAYCLMDNREYLPRIRSYESMNLPFMTAPPTSLEDISTDIEALKSLGVVVQLKIAGDLAAKGFCCWDNDIEKTSWMTGDPTKRCITLAKVLTEYKNSKNQPQLPVQIAPAAIPQQVLVNDPRQPVVAPVEPAIPAPQPRAVAIQPTPVPAKAAKSSTNAAAISDVINAVNSLRDIIQQHQTVEHAALTQHLEIIENYCVDNSIKLKEIAQAVSVLESVVQIQIGLLNLFGQNILQCGPKDVIQIGLQEGKSSLLMLQELCEKLGEGQ